LQPKVRSVASDTSYQKYFIEELEKHKYKDHDDKEYDIK
jgi:hypothetical protein